MNDAFTIRLALGLLGGALLLSVVGIVAAPLTGHPADPDLIKVALATGGFIGGVLVNPRIGNHGNNTVYAPAQVTPGLPPGPVTRGVISHDSQHWTG